LLLEIGADAQLIFENDILKVFDTAQEVL